MYANAIHNITDGKAKKNEIIGILDYTSDHNIQCGAGVVVTKDKLYIQLGSDVWGKNGFLSGGISAKEITFSKLKSITHQPKTFLGWNKLIWQQTDGVSEEYRSIREGKAFDYQAFVDNINKYVKILKGEK